MQASDWFEDESSYGQGRLSDCEFRDFFTDARNIELE
jgi:hypothetical protein